MARFTYTVLDTASAEIIGFLAADDHHEACRLAYLEFCGNRWADRFPEPVEVGRGLAIRPHGDPDPYYADRNATMMPRARTYCENNHTYPYFRTPAR